MKVIGLACSPRLQGNTTALVEEALRAASELGAEVELYLPAEKKIAPCDGCESCQRTGECHTDDDMTELFAKLEGADGILLGSPVYFWSVSAQAKAVIDRTFVYRQDRRLRDKVGAAIAVGRGRGHVGALNALNAFFAIHRMVCVGSATAMGDEAGDVRTDLRGMEEARRIGRSMAALILARKPQAPDRSPWSISSRERPRRRGGRGQALALPQTLATLMAAPARKAGGRVRLAPATPGRTCARKGSPAS